MTWLLTSLFMVAVVLTTVSSAVKYDEQLERDEITEAVNSSAKTTWTGCQPYTLAPCNHSAVDSGLTEEKMKGCDTVDYNKQYKTKCDHDFHTVSSFFFSVIVAGAQNDVYNNGPIETSFDVYEDFFSSKSGVYQYTTGDYFGGHAVKILG